jgi:hypothetical protein
MPNLSRRHLVTTAAALPALALPAAAATLGHEPDPIFAVIEEHRRLWDAWVVPLGALDEAEIKVDDPYPHPLVAWRHYSHIANSELERARDEFLAMPGADVAAIELEYQDAKARERSLIRANRAWYRRNGLTQLKAENERHTRAIQKAGRALGRIRPTTPTGAAALIEYVNDDMWGCDLAWHEPALANITAALRQMPTQAEAVL